MSKTVRIVDLFAGIGGLRNGVVNAIEKHGDKAEIVFVSEIKKPAIATLKLNHPNEEINGDITKVNEKEAPDHDLLLAGFPCQAFSFAGVRKGFTDTTKGTLFFDTARIIAEKKPKYFILENVEGIIQHDPDPQDRKAPVGRTLVTILDTLRSLGYNVQWELLEATHFGVPQARRRIFISGWLGDDKERPKALQGLTTPVKSILEKNKKESDEKVITFSKLLFANYTAKFLLGKAIRDKRGGANNIHSWNIEYWGKTSLEERELLERLALESRKKSWSIINKVHYTDGMPLSVANIMTFTNMPKAKLVKMLNKLVKQTYLFEENGTYRIYSGKLSFPIARILHPDAPAPTLVATDADRIGVVDGKNVRRLTNTEIKRLFGFKDDFKLPKDLPRRQIFDLFGNSVVSPVAEAVADALIYKNN